jgi:hypothetical protein
MRRLLAFISLLAFAHLVNAQDDKGVVRGRVYDEQTNEPIPFANVVIFQTPIGSATNFDGEFMFTGVEPGFVRLQVSVVGYESKVTEEVMVTNAKEAFFDVGMQPTSVALEEAVVKASPFRKTEESPLSMRRIGIKDIEKNPGANRDISKVIQSFPGVAPTPGERNDVIVRGGGPFENSFYLDGVEIPTINHFSTQGASGGPVGILNVDFISEVKFYSGAFPANRGDAMSSVLEFRQVDGNPNELEIQGSLGASEVAMTLDGPLTEKTTFVFSARRSYLQLLFAVLELPFLPTFNDVQFKTKTRIDEKNELTIIGLGALDLFDLNKEANETESQRYILNYLPVNEQWSYTVGAVWKHYKENSYDTWVLSHNFLNNRSYKYQDNIEVDSLQTLDYKSTENEVKFRYENTARTSSGYKFNVGFGAEYARYTNNTFRKEFIAGNSRELNYNTELDLFLWSGFAQASRAYFNERLNLSLGVRIDGNSFDKEMANPLSQFSPRLSASYALTPEWSLTFNTGRYFQKPPYTTLGYRNNEGVLINKKYGLEYIESDHIVSGVEWLPNPNSTLSLEAFYKYYRDYPFSLADSISIASKGSDYGTFGDEAVKSIAHGRAFGIEFLFRHRDLLGFNIIGSYTLVRSESRDMDDNLNQLDSYTPTAWDNVHLFNFTATKSLKRNWDVGFKWRFIGGGPYTPVDLQKSSLISAWQVRGRPYADFSRFNEKRLEAFHQLDVRVDKSYFFDKWSLMLYLDIQNIYNFKTNAPGRYIVQTDQDGNPVVQEDDPSRYVLNAISTESGTILPTIGVMVEF